MRVEILENYFSLSHSFSSNDHSHITWLFYQDEEIYERLQEHTKVFLISVLNYLLKLPDSKQAYKQYHKSKFFAPQPTRQQVVHTRNWIAIKFKHQTDIFDNLKHLPVTTENNFYCTFQADKKITKR